MGLNATDQAILAAYRRRVDGDGWQLAAHPHPEREIADALGLSYARVTMALDRHHVVRKSHQRDVSEELPGRKEGL